MRSLMPKNQKNFGTVVSTVDSRKLVIWNCSISWTISLVPYPLRMRLVNLKRSFFHLKLLSKYIPKIQKFYVLVRFLFKFLLTNNTLKTESWHLLNGPLTISLLGVKWKTLKDFENENGMPNKDVAAKYDVPRKTVSI